MLKGNYENKQVEIKVYGFVSVCEDNYENGEVVDDVNNWSIEEKVLYIENLTDIKELKKAKSFIIGFMNEQLFNSIDEDEFSQEVSIYDCDIEYSQHCDCDNSEPRKSDWDDFESGIINLYIQNIRICVEVNRIQIEEDDLYAILEI